ncbi:MAG TPA: glycosyltransferase family 2 protein [Solirubrobacteraceae bacterium]|nr:glycosyltransferase family 2 protein [Solirubrobacteraceae bacterium]
MKQQEWSAAQRELRRAASSKNASREPPGVQPPVSVIVVCWNAADVLGRCLDHLFAQDYANREILVVDDGSDDETARIAERARERGELTLVRSPRNRGCPAARNLGLGRAAGEIVAFVDADGFAAPDWLSELVWAFGDDPQIGGVASTVFYDDNPLVVNGAGGTTNRQGWAADLSMNESYEHASLAAEALYPMGCGMALRREALERVGPFDDRMLNYYDDVDYGVRLWRAGFRVAVAADAWIDHGVSADDSARKRLWCERHRMRVVLKHAPASSLASWASWELRGLLAASSPVRLQKLRSIGWNLHHLPSALRSRRRLRSEPSAPGVLYDGSWGDGFPAGLPLRLRPAPQQARASIEAARAQDERQLLHGWFPAERVGERSYRWAAANAAVLVHLREPARRLSLDFAHVPVDNGGVDVQIRKVGSPDPLAGVWQTRLAWQYIARSVENHPLELAPGDYEVVFKAPRGWSDPPRETRSLGFALSSLALADDFHVRAGGLNLSSSDAAQQLVSGWYEAEAGPSGTFRWATGRAAAVVRLDVPVHSARLTYRLPPVAIGGVSVSMRQLGADQATWSARIERQDDDWRQESFALRLAPGDYLVVFDADETWSNPGGRASDAPPENRALGFALSELSFV